MLLPPFDQAQQLFRGNLHGHSTHSDGQLSAAAVVEHYAGAGYDFTCLSDHLWGSSYFAADTILDTSDLDRDDFITITSAELHCRGKLYDQDGLWHIVANGLPVDFACATEDETAPELITRAIEAGAYVTIAHPEWYGMTSDEAMTIANAHGVEIYNHSCAVTSARGSGIAAADLLLNNDKRISFTATDDSHFTGGDWSGGWVYVAADNLNAEEIVSALKAGRHYSSSGATFNYIALEGDTLIIDCNPVASITISGQGHLALHQQGRNLTYAEFDLSGFKSNYFRVTIRDHCGGMAWSNPYFRDTLND
ncbi:MAG: phosphotransferase [Alphaproteobacteria bacterium]|nr:phosphotransferase [Alphaproteobacteria bacterium]